MKTESLPKLNKATLGASALVFAAAADTARKAPEWIPLVPAGPVIMARDGRVFVPDHEAAIANFVSTNMSIPLDWDHALDSWGVAPGDSKAAAWIDLLEVRDGALWGRVETWTAKGRESVESMEYRYVSPVIMFDDNLKVVAIPRASLVNNPALIMPALCNQDSTMNEKITALLASFGLDPANLSDESVKLAQETFAMGKAPASAPAPDLSTHVPVEQYDHLRQQPWRGRGASLRRQRRELVHLWRDPSRSAPIRHRKGTICGPGCSCCRQRRTRFQDG